ncbi:MAG: hypothetical protein J1G01_00515 [Clostridiales bacterium]|nr:hypothetical protein [Clostridiales bacterium]
MSGEAFFFEYMRGLLGDRYESFIGAYEDKPRHKALRVNTRKISVADFKDIFKGRLVQNELCHNSFYSDVKPSLDPLYHAGLYYMQEPSASAAVAAFSPYIGERVLDLCAAPGGKSTQAAEYMQGGVIFCNDKEYKRTRALVENIERLGISNAVVTRNTAADYRAAGFDEYFDTLIVDAPCSGGGMMRYESVPYSAEIIEGCAARQRAILNDAVMLLRQGGYMLYSTCTFAREENEDNIEFLLKLGMETVEIPLRNGEERGIGLSDARRVYPMNFDGEGHFYCVLQKTGGGCSDVPHARKKRGVAVFNGLKLDVAEIGGRTVLDFDVPVFDGLNVLRVGTPVYEGGKEPSHALTHALSKDEVGLFGSVEIGEHANEYIRGTELKISAPRGNLIATISGYALGLVKSAPSGDGTNVLKNKYSKFLRVN